MSAEPVSRSARNIISSGDLLNYRRARVDPTSKRQESAQKLITTRRLFQGNAEYNEFIR